VEGGGGSKAPEPPNPGPDHLGNPNQVVSYHQGCDDTGPTGELL
jgi:hypothetical protein